VLGGGQGSFGRRKELVVGRVLDLFPPDAYYALSAMSDRAIVYDREPLVHRMLVIYEAAGIRGETATYLTRSLLSEGRIDYVTVMATKSGLESRRISRAGPTGLITTTTAVGPHPENETRLLSLTVSDSPSQTRAIMIARAIGPASSRERQSWHELQVWLAAQPPTVEVPYARSLAQAIPPVAVRLRRDFGILITLIAAHALLHQIHRERNSDGAIIADFDDYATVRGLVSDIFAESAERSVPTLVRQTVETLAGLAPEDLLNEGLPVTRLATALSLDKSSALRRARIAIARGYIRNLEDRRGRPHRLVLGEPLPEDGMLLPTVTELERLHGCASAEGEGPQARLDYPRSTWDPDIDRDAGEPDGEHASTSITGGSP
jgi:hypothetical protein